MNLIVAFSISKLSPLITRINAFDILTFIILIAKYYYNKDYKTLFLKEGDFVYLRLHKDYNIPINAIITRKLG